MSLTGLVRRELDRYRPKPVQEAKAAVRRRVPPPRRVARRAVEELDDRVGIAKGARSILDHIFPDHWSFLLGEIALYSFVVLVVTGIFLTLYYVPSEAQVVYHGSYPTLQGTPMSEAYRSVVDISLQVRFGLVARQTHHWAADVFIAAIVVHCCRIFFTSAYRRPRGLNWCIGVTMLMLAVANGYMGYSILDDLLSGAGVRIGYSICESIPFVGSYLAYFIWGGSYPGPDWIHRFFILHVLVVPSLIMALLAVHLALIFRQDHTQFPGRTKTEDNVVGTPLWPMFAARSTGLMLMVSGVLVLMGGMFQIDPVWINGPYVPDAVSYASQPDWYMGWLEGALRIAPSWEWTAWGHTVPWMVFLPAIVLPLGTFGILYAWPLVAGRFLHDDVTHHLLVSPRYRPVHSAIGAGFLAFYVWLLIAGGDDVLAHFFGVTLQSVVWAMRVGVVVVPAVVAAVTYRLCKELQGATGRRRAHRPAQVHLDAGRAWVATVTLVPAPSEEEPLEVPDGILPPLGVGHAPEGAD